MFRKLFIFILAINLSFVFAKPFENYSRVLALMIQRRLDEYVGQLKELTPSFESVYESLQDSGIEVAPGIKERLNKEYYGTVERETNLVKEELKELKSTLLKAHDLGHEKYEQVSRISDQIINYLTGRHAFQISKVYESSFLTDDSKIKSIESSIEQTLNSSDKPSVDVILDGLSPFIPGDGLDLLSEEELPKVKEDFDDLENTLNKIIKFHKDVGKELSTKVTQKEKDEVILSKMDTQDSLNAAMIEQVLTFFKDMLDALFITAKRIVD